jgi:hypothetical protein
MNWLELWHFNNKELMVGVNIRLGAQVANFLDTDIQKLIPCYDKCLNFRGNYTGDYVPNSPRTMIYVYV